MQQFSNFRRQERLGAEIESELLFHVTETAEQLEAEGMPRAEALRQARLRFGNVTLQKERTRDQYLFTWLETFVQDLRYAFRLLRRSPGFSIVAVLSLAIGIGAVSAIFSLSDLLLLRPLPVPHPAEVLTVGSTSPSTSLGGISYRDYLDFRDKNTTFSGLSAFAETTVSIARRVGEMPIVRSGLFVSGNFFSVLEVEPQIGRGFRPGEDQALGRDPVVVLGHSLWQSQFNSDKRILGQRIRLNGLEFLVIGVAPERFTGPAQFSRPAVYIPFAMWPALVNSPRNPLEARDFRVLTVKGRLKPGITIQQANAEMQALARELAESYGDINHNIGATVKTEFDARLKLSAVEAMLVVLLSLLAGAVLLVACANVASLLLSRARNRSRETAIRLAVGSGRGRLIRQLLTESLVLALAGGAFGLLLAFAGISAFSRINSGASDTQLMGSTHLDSRVLFFSLAVSVFSTLLFGLAPALQASKQDINLTLKDGAGLGMDASGFWGRNNLVRIQIACSMMLVVVASIVYLGFRGPLASSPGFRIDHLVLMTFQPELSRYTEAQAQQFFRRLTERVSEEGGVRSVTLTSSIPMSFEQQATNIVPEGYQLPRGVEFFSVLSSIVDDNYFSTMGIPLVRGRALTSLDKANAPLTAVINEELAKRYWPGQEVIGKRFRLNGRAGPFVEIVGVAKTAKYTWIAETPQSYLYLPLRQHPQNRMTLAAYISAGPAKVIPALRKLVGDLDSNQPVYNVRTMEEFYRKQAIDTPTVLTETIAALGLMGLGLAMVGLYGLVAYSVLQRTREIGVRVALGADRRTILKMVLRDGLRISLTGAVFGLLAGFAVEHIILANFSTAKSDALTFIILPPLVVLVTLLASAGPARRAALIDPMVALRYE
ncbi:MAG: ABC transporter permease [Acidobacteriaceae bacterium]|nr:ABC transporter permease [Acidobacteriaceae bacterium]